MAWAKNGTPDTLTSSGSTLQITDLTAYKFNQFLIHSIQVTGDINQSITFNNNSNTVYANRRSENGGADATHASEAEWERTGNVSVDIFQVMYVCSISGEEKLGIRFWIDQGTAGAGTAPRRVEAVSKFVPSPDADITRIDVIEDQAGSYDTDSNLSALGTD